MTGALLVVPRPAVPHDIPEPFVAPAVINGVMREDRKRARELENAAKAGTLENEIRLLGNQVRAFGRAVAAGDERALEPVRRKLVNDAAEAIAKNPERVLALRAHQALAFAEEAQRFEWGSPPSENLVELGGVFPVLANEYTWFDTATRRLFLSEAELTVLFKKRWNDITGLTGKTFAVSLDEERLLLRFYLNHPPVEKSGTPASTSPAARRALAVQDQVKRDEKRRAKVQELAKIDPSYPAALADGVLLFRLGKFEEAAIAFDRHLTVHPDGPHALRARNYLKAALEAR
ncbi:MAG: hypothetical protein IPK82_27980 [Polyangiaceae bacterium]|nr:hypothetical protein [Polyangiaceae bacterium]